LIVAYFATTGRFEIFRVTTFTNARAYAEAPLFNIYRYVREFRFFPDVLHFTVPVMALVALGAFRDRRVLGEHYWALHLTSLVAVQSKIALNGTGFLPH
jgi:hypothetical protein